MMSLDSLPATSRQLVPWHPSKGSRCHVRHTTSIRRDDTSRQGGATAGPRVYASFTALSLLWFISSACAVTFDCFQRCSAGRSVVVVGEEDSYCHIVLPDNPYLARPVDHTDLQTRILPCEMEIQSNCSNYCQIQLQFNKFELSTCGQNITNDTLSTFRRCDIVDSCEYVVLHEEGTLLDGELPLTPVRHFHGQHTDTIFTSQTDKVRLQFCYRSETFSARNIQMAFKVVDPTVTRPLYFGPLSVYVLGGLVFFMIAVIAILRWNKSVGHCLDPPVPVKQDSV